MNAAAYREALIDAGLLIPTGVDGLYGRSAVFESVAEALDATVTRLAAGDGAERLRFPPVLARDVFLASGYLESFPHLAGTVQCFCGNEADHRRLLAALAAGGDGAEFQRPAEIVLTPAACYPVYPVIAARGRLAPAGALVDVCSYCFRHEPSVDPCRMQMFRIREQVRIGTAEQVQEFRAEWLQRGAALLAGLGLPGKTLRADLAILGRPPERLLAEQATAAVAGLLVVPAMAGLLAAGGVSAGWQLPAGSAVVLAVAGFTAPALAVRQEAAARRAATRHALAAFLDLVVIAIAGGAGVEAALTYAAATGQGPAFAQLRQALETARLTRQPPWQTLGQLGTELGVTELTELAASITLAGTEGARVRASLAAKSAAMRARQLAEAEAGAQAATERMSLPLVILFAGFMLLIGFPAVMHVIEGI
jgi:tight adherence protein C